MCLKMKIWLIISKTQTNKISGEITSIKETRGGPINKTKASAIRIRTSIETLMTIDRVVHLDGITMEEVVVSITVITIHICSVSRKIKGMGPKIMIKKKDIKIKVIKTHISNFRIKTDSAISKINSISLTALASNFHSILPLPLSWGEINSLPNGPR